MNPKLPLWRLRSLPLLLLASHILCSTTGWRRAALFSYGMYDQILELMQGSQRERELRGLNSRALYLVFSTRSPKTHATSSIWIDFEESVRCFVTMKKFSLGAKLGRISLPAVPYPLPGCRVCFLKMLSYHIYQ
ncbi:hypothetical protein B0H12DRAFT_1123988 [Mycena haematopus]|nr:hypothetical protein B0H12DRAFT_1123988 [Mycena haematopus]